MYDYIILKFYVNLIIYITVNIPTIRVIENKYRKTYFCICYIELCEAMNTLNLVVGEHVL